MKPKDDMPVLNPTNTIPVACLRGRPPVALCLYGVYFVFLITIIIIFFGGNEI